MNKHIMVVLGGLTLIAVGIYCLRTNEGRVRGPAPVAVEVDSRSQGSPGAGPGLHRGVIFTPRAGATGEDWRPTPVDLEKLGEILPSGLRSVQDVLAVSNYFIEKRIAERSSQPIKRPDEILIPENATPEVEMKVLGQKADAIEALKAGLVAFNNVDEPLLASFGSEKYALFKRFEHTEELADKLSMLEEGQKGDNHRAAAEILLQIAQGKGAFDERRNELTGPLGQSYVQEHEKALRYWATDRVPRRNVVVNHGE